MYAKIAAPNAVAIPIDMLGKTGALVAPGSHTHWPPIKNHDR